MSAIGRLDASERTWSLAGSLNHGRYGHGVIFDGRQLLVVGGDNGGGKLKTENCIPHGKTVYCTTQGRGIDGYAYYPELGLVADNYGNDC